MRNKNISNNNNNNMKNKFEYGLYKTAEHKTVDSLESIMRINIFFF